MRRLALVLCLLPGLALAQSPEQRPQHRPMVQATTVARPMPRPIKATSVAAAEAAFDGPRPKRRPKGLYLAQAPEPEVTLVSAPEPQPQVQKPVKQTMKGAVCGMAEIKGRQLAAMRSTTKGCGIANPVEISAIAGVSFSPAPTINCAEAAALAQWITGTLQPAFSGQVKGLQVADSYSCRPRNNVRGNPVSVHGKGEAIDLSAVILTTGKVVEVKSRLDRRWQKARKGGCGTFTVILGPGSDGYHENHIHLDVSQHGGNPYCR